ncbi:hypothetical protein D5086_000092 [Populus alba]|uniref:Uncharacterized protein n=1 Tax=Populus alba TaxID=43335 RepID=A0ACC4CW49_POPAL
MASFNTLAVLSLYLLSLLLLSKSRLSLSLVSSDIHDLLPQYGLPRGLLPDNVESYTLPSSDGSFEVKLKTPYYVHFDDVVYYDKVIKGKLSYGSVHDVSGIQAKKLFIWLPVTGIEVSKADDGMISFFVGPISEELPAKQFEDVPACSDLAVVIRGFPDNLGMIMESIWSRPAMYKKGQHIVLGLQWISAAFVMRQQGLRLIDLILPIKYKGFALSSSSSQAYMESHKEVAKHDGLNIDDRKSDGRRKTRMRNWLVVEDGWDDINEKAEAFIKNFRNQLKIQRQDSLKRFQEMISRGA